MLALADLNVADSGLELWKRTRSDASMVLNKATANKLTHGIMPSVRRKKIDHPTESKSIQKEDNGPDDDDQEKIDLEMFMVWRQHANTHFHIQRAKNFTGLEVKNNWNEPVDIEKNAENEHGDPRGIHHCADQLNRELIELELVEDSQSQ